MVEGKPGQGICWNRWRRYISWVLIAVRCRLHEGPATIDAWLAALHEETRRSRIRLGRDPEIGELLKVEELRADLTAERRAESLRIGRIGFASAGAKRKPKEAIAA